MRGIVLMQTSGFATLANVLASLAVPCQIPVADVGVGARHARRVQPRPGDGLPDHAAGAGFARAWSTTRSRGSTSCEFIVDRTIKQAVATQAPVALILSPLLTGGKVFKASEASMRKPTRPIRPPATRR